MFDEVRKRFGELEGRKDLARATFAGGCFWCIEPPFRNKEGVVDVLAGYANGEVENPTYEDVVRGGTASRESVRVYFDPKKVDFKELVDIYWLQIDPTDSGGQFADRGEQYRTAIYWDGEEQKKVAEKSKEELSESGRYEGKIVTEILPVKSFYPAEDYHQSFYLKNPEHYEQYSTFSGRKKYVEEIKRKIEEEKRRGKK